MSSAVEAVWDAWIKHVAQCTDRCKTVGRDCVRAAELRLELRAARTAEQNDNPMTAAPGVAAEQYGGHAHPSAGQ